MATLFKPFQRVLLTHDRIASLLRDGLRNKIRDLGLYVLDGVSAGNSIGVVLWNVSTARPSFYCVASATNAAVDIDGTSGSPNSRMVTGEGEIAAPGALGTFQVLDGSAVDYVLGCAVVDVPASVVENLNTPGVYSYATFAETVGYTAAAGTVTDSGGGVLKIIVDNLLDTNEGDNTALSDTSIRVMLKATEDGGTVGPQTDSGTSWYEDCAIHWDGSNNYINTSSYLGQSSPSTTSTDYSVYLLGPVCRRVATGLPSSAAPFCFYTGAGSAAAVTDVLDYRDASSGIKTQGRYGSEDHYRLATKRGRGTGAAAIPALPVGVHVEGNDDNSTSVSNTTSLTYFDTSVNIAGSTFKGGDSLDFEFLAEIETLGGGGTVDWQLRLDSTSLFTLSHGTPSPGDFVHIRGTLHFLTNGANTAIRAVALVSMGSADASTGGTSPELYEEYHSSITTGDRELRLGVQFGTADATNLATCRVARGYMHGPF